MTGVLKGLGWRGVIGAFNKRLEEVQKASWVPEVALEVTTDQLSEDYGFLADTPAMVEHDAGPRPKKPGVPIEFTLRNKKFSAGLDVDEDDARRDKTGQVMIRARELAARAAALPQKIISQLLIANGNAYDGVSYFHATNHRTLNGDVIANAQTFNASSGTTPSVIETEDALLQGIETILEFKDDEGEPRNEAAQRFLLIVPPRLWKQVAGALKSDYTAAGVSNKLKATDFTIRAAMNARLATPFMYLFRADSDVKPFVWQDEVLPVMQYLGEGSEHAIKTMHHLFQVKRICNGGYGRFDQACRIEFT